MAWIRNNCVQEEDTITFEIDNSCTSIDTLDTLIKENQKCCKGNSFLINDLYNQLLDLNKLVKVLSTRCVTPCYNLCVTPASTQVVALKPVSNYIKPSPVRRIQKITECKPIIVTKSNMIWTNSLAYEDKGDIPILGLGNFRKKGDRLVNQHGKDLYDFLPVHFGKQIGDLVYMGIVDYKWIGQRRTIYEEWMLEYQVYDTKTTVTKIYPAGIFHWKQYADNKINII